VLFTQDIANSRSGRVLKDSQDGLRIIVAGEAVFADLAAFEALVNQAEFALFVAAFRFIGKA